MGPLRTLFPIYMSQTLVYSWKIINFNYVSYRNILVVRKQRVIAEFVQGLMQPQMISDQLKDLLQCLRPN